MSAQRLPGSRASAVQHVPTRGIFSAHTNTKTTPATAWPMRLVASNWLPARARSWVATHRGLAQLAEVAALVAVATSAQWLGATMVLGGVAGMMMEITPTMRSLHCDAARWRPLPANRCLQDCGRRA